MRTKKARGTLARRVSRLGLVLAVLLVATLAAAAPAAACSCVMPDPPPGAFAQADAVFRGRVTSIRDAGLGLTGLIDELRRLAGLTPASGPGTGRRVAFAVSESWKGVTTTQVQVTTGYGGGDCGFPFDVGKDYLVYAYRAPEGLTVTICSRTGDVAGAASDLAYVSTLPVLPLTAVAQPVPWLLVGVILLVLAGGGVAIIAVRRRREPAG